MLSKYKTEQRKNILDYLIKNQNKFVNAKEIANYLKENNQLVGLTTIYRYLEILEKDNRVRVETKNHTQYYQYVENESTTNLFLKCKECGNSMSLECKEFEDINNHIKKEHNFTLDQNTIIYGICESCSKK